MTPDKKKARLLFGAGLFFCLAFVTTVLGVSCATSAQTGLAFIYQIMTTWLIVAAARRFLEARNIDTEDDEEDFTVVGDH